MLWIRTRNARVVLADTDPLGYDSYLETFIECLLSRKEILKVSS